MPIDPKALSAAEAAFYAAPVSDWKQALRTAIEAYEAAYWRPIAEAQKDATPRLLRQGRTQQVGWWDDDAEMWRTGPYSHMRPTQFRELGELPEGADPAREG